MFGHQILNTNTSNNNKLVYELSEHSTRLNDNITPPNSQHLFMPSIGSLHGHGRPSSPHNNNDNVINGQLAHMHNRSSPRIATNLNQNAIAVNMQMAPQALIFNTNNFPQIPSTTTVGHHRPSNDNRYLQSMSIQNDINANNINNINVNNPFQMRQTVQLQSSTNLNDHHFNQMPSLQHDNSDVNHTQQINLNVTPTMTINNNLIQSNNYRSFMNVNVNNNNQNLLKNHVNGPKMSSPDLITNTISSSLNGQNGGRPSSNIYNKKGAQKFDIHNKSLKSNLNTIKLSQNILPSWSISNNNNNNNNNNKSISNIQRIQNIPKLPNVSTLSNIQASNKSIRNRATFNVRSGGNGRGGGGRVGGGRGRGNNNCKQDYIEYLEEVSWSNAHKYLQYCPFCVRDERKKMKQLYWSKYPPRDTLPKAIKKGYDRDCKALLQETEDNVKKTVIFTSGVEYRRHYDEFHKKYGFKCIYSGCDKESSSWYNFVAHLTQHDREHGRPFYCGYNGCNRRSSTKHNLIKHLQGVHKWKITNKEEPKQSKHHHKHISSINKLIKKENHLNNNHNRKIPPPIPSVPIPASVTASSSITVPGSNIKMDIDQKVNLTNNLSNTPSHCTDNTENGTIFSNNGNYIDERTNSTTSSPSNFNGIVNGRNNGNGNVNGQSVQSQQQNQILLSPNMFYQCCLNRNKPPPVNRKTDIIRNGSNNNHFSMFNPMINANIINQNNYTSNNRNTYNINNNNNNNNNNNHDQAQPSPHLLKAIDVYLEQHDRDELHPNNGQMY